MTKQEIQKELDAMPDLYFSGVELPETLTKFWAQYALLNSKHTTITKDGGKVCGCNYSRSLSEIYCIVKAKYKVSFEEFLKELVPAKVYDSYWRGFIACKSVYKVTMMRVSDCSGYSYKDEGYLVDKDKAIIVYKKDYHSPTKPFDETFSELEKSIYYLLKETIPNYETANNS